ncbi:hypothetical protein GUJ93_ZPchr0012g21294 [Zizania palustris]|uniref:Uncharacterized protein n=1 Tax=Zizania palustris TaxID=103762 RepID=A0A8J5WP49_ZIZPA|nr:hypothetical protein GUJ93_ZPchr0012g21294 [Zizania palustris]
MDVSQELDISVSSVHTCGEGLESSEACVVNGVLPFFRVITSSVWCHLLAACMFLPLVYTYTGTCTFGFLMS